MKNGTIPYAIAGVDGYLTMTDNRNDPTQYASYSMSLQWGREGQRTRYSCDWHDIDKKCVFFYRTPHGPWAFALPDELPKDFVSVAMMLMPSP